MIRQLLGAAVLVAAGCGSTPSQPTPQPQPQPTPTPQVLTLSGAVTATNGGQALSDVRVEAASVSSTTDGSGRYSLNLPVGTVNARFTISGSGIVTRSGFFSNGPSRSVDLDAFTLAAFDQQYFRAIARNGFEEPASLQPVRRWTRGPMIYIRTVDDTGAAILPEVLQQVVTLSTNLVPLYTGGRFSVAAIEQGTETRRNQAGWITVEWTRNATQFCGAAHVGQEGGSVTLTYDQPGCSCGSQKIRPRTVKHELGHAMGMWHSGQAVDLMSGFGASECDRNMTARELQYLEYIYRRAVGNTDPDNDPSSGALLMPIRVIN
jgi:hypothetical protein